MTPDQKQTIAQYLGSAINEPAIGQEAQTLLGHFSFVVGVLGESEKRQLELEMEIRRHKETFGEELGTTGQKVSEAMIERRVINYDPYVKALGELNKYKALERTFNLLREGLKMRHEAVVALTMRQAAEMKLSRT